MRIETILKLEGCIHIDVYNQEWTKVIKLSECKEKSIDLESLYLKKYFRLEKEQFEENLKFLKDKATLLKVYEDSFELKNYLFSFQDNLIIMKEESYKSNTILEY